MSDFGGIVTRGRAFWPIVQGRTVGGSTVINSAICAHLPDDIIADWESRLGMPARTGDRIRAIQDDLDTELHVGPVPTASLGNNNLLAVEAASRRGFDAHITRRYAPDCRGTGQCLQGCRAGAKLSLNLNFVPEVMRRGGTVVSCAPVRRITVRGGRASAVTGHFVHPTRRRGARFRLGARKAVLVAASVTRSANLLRRSGVKHPALGNGFRAHPGTGVFGIYDDPVDMNLGTTQGWATTSFRHEPGFKLETLSIPPELVASRLKGGGRALVARLTRYRHIAMWVVATRAESVGRVRPGVFGMPAVHYTLNRRDMERLRAGMLEIARMHFAAGARTIVPGIHGLPYELGPDEVGALEQAPLDPRHYVAVLSHLFGGCTMGADERTAVCDHQGRVRGVQGLVIADASQIPTNLGVNPQHTIMTLGRLRAEQLLDNGS